MIKRINPAATFKVICSLDDALDRETPEEQASLTLEKKKSRYETYLEKLDESVLKFKAGSQPTRFIVRPLKSGEQAEFNEKFFAFDPVRRKIVVTNRAALLMAMFEKACTGIEDGGVTTPVKSADDVPYEASIEIGAVIQIISTLDFATKNG